MVARQGQGAPVGGERPRDAARLARGEAGAIRIGFVKTAIWTSVLPRALRQFRAKHPHVKLELKNARPAAQLRAIARGELDLAFVHEAPKGEAFTSHALREDPLALAVPADHALAARKAIAPKDLEGADWIALAASRRGGSDQLLAACAKRGFVPNVCFTAHDQETVLGLVSSGMGLAFLPESIRASRATGVVLRQLPWLEMSRSLHVVVRSGHVSAATTAFAACLKEVARV